MSRWWNGVWGRLSRRDVWLTQEVRWHVWARSGDSETGRTLHWVYDDEESAREMATRLMSDGGDWREVPVTR